MPEYPRSSPIYYAVLGATEEQAEMDCPPQADLIQDNEDSESMEYWLCSMHGNTRRLLDDVD
jgi:hypothetical protein